MKIIASKYIHIMQLLRNEKRSMDELIHYQNITLRKLVAHAYSTTKFYNKLYNNCGLHPNDIRSIEDLSKIPIIDKQTIRQNTFDDLISEDYKKKKLIPVTTTGTSGMMLKFYIDNSFDQLRKAQFLRPYITNGKRFLDKTLVFSPPKPNAKKWFQQFGIMPEKKVYFNSPFDEQITVIQEYKPAVIRSCASVLNLLALKILDEKILIHKPHLVFTDSEILTINMRKNIEEAFGGEVIDIYGTYETDNIAYECHHHNGYHIAIDCVIMEFIYNGRKAEKFEVGEIVVTVLNNFAMPFIRYNLHDLSSYHPGTCPCGRTFPLLTNIRGRSDDYMITADGNKLSFASLGAYLHPLTEFVYEFQIIQEDINTFAISIVPNNSFNDGCKKIIVSEINKYFPDANIDIKLVSAIQREGEGKFMAFKSKVK